MRVSQPIGVFDSGVGGMTVAKKIREMLPGEDLLYVADSRHAPYGNKSQAFIVQRAHAIVNFMLQHQAKAIVVACNTATLVAIQPLRTNFTTPIIGVEPGIKPAALQTKSAVIGVMVTTRTSLSETFHQLVKRYSESVRIEVQACDGLVELVETGDLDSHTTRALVASYVQPLLAKGVDTIALGCTHYPFLLALIQQIAGPDIGIIETGTAVAKQVVRRLTDEACLISDNQAGTDVFFTTGDATANSALMSNLWGCPIKVNTCSI